jgi:hypothetical protein
MICFFLINANFKIESKKLPDDFKNILEMNQGFHRLLIAYSLLYVVIEAFLNLKLNNDTLIKQLYKGKYLNDFRRLRNATFHYQKEVDPDKIYDFINSDGSKEWVHETHKAFENYFLSFEHITQCLESIKSNLNEE